MNDNKRELFFQKKFECSLYLNLSLSEKQIQDIIVEFIWFFNGSNNIKFLIENDHLEYVDVLYDKYCKEIDNLIKYYELAEIIEESEYFHGWFNNWKKLEKFTLDQFFSKIKTDLEFSSIWADFGMSDSIEFRNWGIQINHDNDDSARISHKGKDQYNKLLSSLVEDPEYGFHFINIFNPTNIEDRLLKHNWLTTKFYCNKLTYEQRIKWFFLNFYETGMEYEALLESCKKDDLDNFKWYGEKIQLPKYSLNILSDYNKIENKYELEKIMLYNYFLLIHTSSTLGYITENIIINSTYKINSEENLSNENNYKFEFSKKKFDNINLELNDFKFIKI